MWGVDLRGDAWDETAEVVTEKAVEKYGGVFADDQFDAESVRYDRLSTAQTWSIDGDKRLCVAEVIADWTDPENADVTVVCGGTELPRVD